MTQSSSSSSGRDQEEEEAYALSSIDNRKDPAIKIIDSNKSGVNPFEETSSSAFSNL
jgi:hypothetical protein